MRLSYTLIYFLLFVFSANAQISNIDLNEYSNFLRQNENLTYEELLDKHPAGEFLKNTNSQINDALYLDSIKIKYQLTDDEKFLLQNNGFVVTERISFNSFGQALNDVFHKDLPLFVSSDAVLHALHMSYDKILKDVELTKLIPSINELLDLLYNNIGELENRYSSDENMKPFIEDLDFYLSVPKSIMANRVESYYSQNHDSVVEQLNLIEEEQFATVEFFSSIPRKVDYSQFKPRGHYVDEYHPELEDYFRTMIWFGRMELYLIAPSQYVEIPVEDIQRQAVISNLLLELIDLSGANSICTKINDIIKTFVGFQDNVTLEHLRELKTETGFDNSKHLTELDNFSSYQDLLAQKPYADQKILSQVLLKQPFSTTDLKPASSFLLFGQRFIIDSYVTGSLVYDKIKFDGNDIKRMLPSTLDILYSLGNNAAIQLLDSELNEYKYSSNLAALRYLIDSYGREFWDYSIYNNWLNSIRMLNPPTDRSFLPEFMQTAAWWQQKMNTQLASWTELRHDNLLYAKQSYTGGITCSFPLGYVEPFPRFYEELMSFADNTKSKLNELNLNSNGIDNYFDSFHNICDTLMMISEKELNSEELNSKEKNFLKSALYESGVCGIQFDGWYTDLYYNDNANEELLKQDNIVADFHTAPTDETGNMVGWVKHAGTGQINLLTTVVPDFAGNDIAYVGPVMSYHEYTSTNFKRITDDEWKEQYLASSARPEWTNIYLADINGEKQEEGPTLVTSIDDKGNPNYNVPKNYLTASNYPNPFNPETIISFVIPSSLTNNKVELTVHNIQGELIKNLVSDTLPSGTYLVKWDGTNNGNSRVSSGTYFYRLTAKKNQFVGKMILVK